MKTLLTQSTASAPDTPDLPIGGITPLTTIDFPGLLASVIFLRGCPWRCPYCHNSRLQSGKSQAGDTTWNQLFAFLKKRQGFLEAVVFSGGEPTQHEHLSKALREVRRLGFKTGLHTAGIYPKRLAKLLPLLDWVGLDIKAPLDGRYDRITGQKQSATSVRKSLSLLMISGKPFQLRTTRSPQLLSPADCCDLEKELQLLRAPKTCWQEAKIF
jgi:pyruvate formate lyase activating enzyme